MNPRQLLCINKIQSFCYKQYFNYVCVEKVRYASSRLRVELHKLMIETRWNISDPIVLRDRKCYTCNDIQDEYHFVLSVQCMIAFD